MGDSFVKEESNVFLYRYNTAANPSAGNTIVEHAAENWMMFRGTSTGYFPFPGYIQYHVAHDVHRFNGSTTFQPMTPSDDTFAEELIAYWLSFVRSGNPNTHKLARSPTWSAFNTNSRRRVVLQEGTVNRSASFMEEIPAAEISRCAFVASKAVDQQA